MSRRIGPCKTCGSEERTTNGSCRPCVIRRSAEWAKANPEKHLAQKQKWLSENREHSNTVQKKWKADNPERTLLHSAKTRANKKNQPFDITLEDIIIPEFCPVLGIKLEHSRGSTGSIDSSPSLDKTIPELGYVKGNIVVMSARANRLKCDASLQEIQKLLAYMNQVNHE